MRASLHIFFTALLCMLVFPFGAVAQENEEQLFVTVNGHPHEYTEVFTDIQDVKSYYHENDLILSTQDINGDGDPEVWVLYEPNLAISKELRDTDGDGKPDVFVTFNADENITSMTGDGLQQFETRADEGAVGNSPLTTDPDYAGNLENIERLAGETGGFNLWLFLLLILLTVGTWWKYKKP